MLQEMNGVKTSPQHVFVLAATNLPDAIDPAIKSRFEEQIQIDYPDGPQRQRLFKNMIGKLPVDFDRDAIAAELAGLTPNLGGRDIQSIIRRASQRAVRRSGGIAKAAMLTRADLIGEVRMAPPA
jgi:SpoVK/Ycf46/Vps4 family AAA+-type ATPase